MLFLLLKTKQRSTESINLKTKNMKKIIISLSVIGVVSAIVIGGTVAYFSDTETSTGNVISAGTLSLSAGQSFTDSVRLEDLKPSYVRFMEFTVTNDGNNPLRLWKHIENITTDESGINEPEQQWYDDNGIGTEGKNDIDTVIEYDMYVGGEIEWDDEAHTTGHVEGGEVIIHEDDGITLADVESHYIYIGELQPEETITIIQSYHMATDTENWAQSDTLTFDIELLALQLNAPGPDETTLLLENKTPEWDRITGDGRYGILTYKTENDDFDYDLIVKGLNPNADYALVYAPDPWPQSVDSKTTKIGTLTTDGDGNGSILGGNVDLGYDIPHPNEDNYPNGGKIWVVLDADHNGTQMTTWNQAEYLYEYNLIKYEDTNN